MRQLLARRLPLKAEGGVFRAIQFVIGAQLNKGVVISLSLMAHRVLS